MLASFIRQVICRGRLQIWWRWFIGIHAKLIGNQPILLPVHTVCYTCDYLRVHLIILNHCEWERVLICYSRRHGIFYGHLVLRNSTTGQGNTGRFMSGASRHCPAMARLGWAMTKTSRGHVPLPLVPLRRGVGRLFECR